MAVASHHRLILAAAALALLMATLGAAGPAWPAPGGLGYTLPPALLAGLFMAGFLQRGRPGYLVGALVCSAVVLTFRGTYDAGFWPWLPPAVVGVFGASQMATWSLELDPSPPAWLPRLVEELLLVAAAGVLTAVARLLTVLPHAGWPMFLVGSLAAVGVFAATAWAAGRRSGSGRPRRPGLEPLHGQDQERVGGLPPA